MGLTEATASAAVTNSPAFTAEDVARFYANGWWTGATISDAVRTNAIRTPDRTAYVDYPNRSLTWREFDAAATALAGQLTGTGVRPGDRIAVWHGDTTAIHVLFVAIERCGAVVVGVGARAGIREVTAILHRAEPQLLLTDPPRQDQARTVAAAIGCPALTLDGLTLGADAVDLSPDAQLGPDDVFLINSTSGTTGLPKCVVHTQNRWRYFHQQAVANGLLTSDDVLLPVIPTPFGFGLWTTHITPILLGSPTVLLDRFTVAAACAAIEQHRVTVLCCVSTQLTMIMADPASRDYDLSSLRVVFTGGEALPYRPAHEFEKLTGATILQFYGSNETGLLSGTTVHDSLERRLRTGGRVTADMAVRLFDGDTDVTDTGRGQPACRGPATSLGYLGGTDHDKLFTADGWMRMGDICEIDADGYLRVTGRTSDFIVRGGKNISAAQVEDVVMTHPAVGLAAAVAMPDPVFGEKVCVYVELATALVGAPTLELGELCTHLLALDVSKELLPERLIVVEELPRSSGGKVAKGQLREDIRARMGDGHDRS